VAYQIGALEVFARAAGTRVSYVKPHGALYNRVVHDEEQAAAVVDGVLLADVTLPVLGLPGSRLLEAAEKAGLESVTEAFADRAYTEEGTLLPRGQEGAVVTDFEMVVERSLGLARDRAVTAHSGALIEIEARSLCLHGDTSGAVELARRVRAHLESSGVLVEAFV
jgi:5-oxoprolinase (ATP-hydrolysing) subunit A